MSSLKEAFQSISPLYLSGRLDFKGRQAVNFTVDGSGAPVTNLTDLTLDGGGHIIGVFAGKIYVSTSISGANTTVLATVYCHDKFEDTTSKLPIFIVTQSKLGGDPPVGQNYTQEKVVATTVVINGSTNGSLVLHFDGYIIPVVPFDTISTSPSPFAFGNVANGATKTLPLTLKSYTKGHAPGDNGPRWILTLPTRYTASLTSGGSYSSPLTATSSDGTDLVVYVKFSPNAVAAFNGNIAITSVGTYAITAAVTGAGV